MADKEKILVVDDEPSIRKYLQTLLEVDGFDVETVSSGKEALERIGTGERPDFIDSGRADAGDGRPGDAAPIDAGGPQPQRHHAFLLERSHHGGRSDSHRRARLPDQAV